MHGIASRRPISYSCCLFRSGKKRRRQTQRTIGYNIPDVHTTIISCDTGCAVLTSCPNPLQNDARAASKADGLTRCATTRDITYHTTDRRRHNIAQPSPSRLTKFPPKEPSCLSSVFSILASFLRLFDRSIGAH